MKNKLKKNKSVWVLLIMFLAMVIVNIIAWLAPYVDKKFHIGNICDLYTDKIFPIWLNTYGRITNFFPFSVGEIMIVLEVILVLVAILCLPICFLMRKKEKLFKFSKRIYLIFAYINVIVGIIMTLNCTILYHVSPIDGNPRVRNRDYTVKELEILRNYVVDKCNELSKTFQRDKDGYVVYDITHEEIKEEIIDNLNKLDDEFPRLKGYYPNIKPLLFSRLFTQANTLGYYFPFSMESNYNKLLYDVYIPCTYAHEYSHIKGYIYEDEASYIGYRACIESKDLFIQYSAYIDAYYYLNRAYLESINYDKAILKKQPKINKKVKFDYVSLVKKDVIDDINEHALIDSKKVNQVSNHFTDASLNLNGVEDGMASYGRVVDLLLQYYDGKLY